jgi:hypothetical protein
MRLPQQRTRARARAACPPTNDPPTPLAKARQRQRPPKPHRYAAAHTRAPQRHPRTGRRRHKSATVTTPPPPPSLPPTRSAAARDDAPPTRTAYPLQRAQPHGQPRQQATTPPPHHPPWRVSDGQTPNQQALGPSGTRGAVVRTHTWTAHSTNCAKPHCETRYDQLHNHGLLGTYVRTNARTWDPTRRHTHLSTDQTTS